MSKPEHPLSDWEKAVMIPAPDFLRISHGRGVPPLTEDKAESFAIRQQRTAEWLAAWEEFERLYPNGLPPSKSADLFIEPPESPTLREVMSMHTRERFDYHGVDRYPDFPPSDAQVDELNERHRQMDEERARMGPYAMASMAPPPPKPTFWKRIKQFLEYVWWLSS